VRLLTPTLGLLLILLGGCGSTRLAYNNADWLLRQAINRDTCPTSDQEAWLEREVDALHLWHRRQELPRYAQVLRRLARGVAPGVKAAEMEAAMQAFFPATRDAVKRLSARVARPAGEYLSRLNPAQHRCMTRGMIRRYKKYGADLRLSQARYLRRQLDKLEDRLDDWFGDFTGGQQQLMEQAIIKRKPLHHRVTLAWRSWSWRLITILQGAEAPEERARKVRAVILDRFRLYNQKEREQLRRWEKGNQEITLAVARLMTAEQRRRLTRRLLDLAGDLEEISRE